MFFRCSKIIDFSLLKSFTYWSVSIGASSAFISDIGFVAMIPGLLGDIGVKTSDIVVMMTVHFGCDLAGRILYSLINVFYITRNRYVYYIGVLLTAIFRIGTANLFFFLFC